MLKPERSEVLEPSLDSELEPRPSSFWWRWTKRILFLAVIIATTSTYKIWRPWVDKWMPAPAAQATRPPMRPTPVAIAKSQQENVDLYINALGTVTAFNTVTVKSRVDGELKRVAFKEGQSVKQGELLAELDARPFEAMRDQAKGQLQRDEAQLELAKVNLQRARQLRARDANSQQEYDESNALFKQAESIVKVDQANLQNAQLQVDYTRIVAPISGRIGLRIVDLGNIVKANDPNGIMVITQLQPISLLFAIPQDDILRVQTHLKKYGELKVLAFNRDFSTQLAEGTLTAIDNQVDPATGTLRLKATFANEDNVLFPNEFVNVRLKVETLENAITVPSIAVQRGPKERFVYVVKKEEKDNVVEVRPVTVGPAEGLTTVINSGLDAGEIVVTEGLDKLQPGSKVILPKSE